MTTIIAVRRNGKTVLGSDGQVTGFQRFILKGSTKKIRKLYNNKVLIGFSGAVVDCLTFVKLLEKALEKHQGNLLYSATEVLRECQENKEGWRLGLEAYMIAADKTNIVYIGGSGEVMKIEEDVVGTGSGGFFAQSAAQALLENTTLSLKEIVKKSLTIASSIDVYTNTNFTIEEI